MEKNEFYQKCAELLGAEDLYVEKPLPSMRFNRETGKMYQPLSRHTRWGPREPGNGRFPGHGTIRVFSEKMIHVSLNDPSLSGTFTSFEAVLEALRLATDYTSKEVKELEVGDFVHVVLADKDHGLCELVRKVEEYDNCWKVKVNITYSNGQMETVERYYYEEKESP